MMFGTNPKRMFEQNVQFFVSGAVKIKDSPNVFCCMHAVSDSPHVDTI
jgi:hypothetical protein